MPLTETWVVLGRRLAVIAAVTTALVCLLAHNTLLTASIRGTAALVSALIVVWIGRHALSWFPSKSTSRKSSTSNGTKDVAKSGAPRRAGA